MDKLNRFYFSDNLSIDNALSTNHIIHQLINQYNKLIDFLNDLEFDYKSYVDDEIVKLHNQINTQLSELENVLNDKIELNSLDINELKSRADLIETNIANIMLDITKFKSDVENEFNDVRNEISTVFHSLQAELLALKNYVDDLIKRMTVKVYSNYDGCKKDIKDALNDVYNYNRRVVGSSISFGRLKEYLNALITITVTNPYISGSIKSILTFGKIKRMLGASGSGISTSGINNNIWFSTKIVQYQSENPDYSDESNFKEILPLKKPSFLELKLYGFIIWLCLLQSEVTYQFSRGLSPSDTVKRQCATGTIKALWTSLGLGNEEILPITARGWSNKL